MSKVSIVIPAYENPKALDRLLDSIAYQTYTDYKIFITDDSKTDKDYEVVKKWMADERTAGKIIYERNESSKGATDNTIYVMSKADGEYLKIMHHDDSFAESSSLEKMVKLLDENKDVDFAFAGTCEIYYDENGDEVDGKRVLKSIPDLEASMLLDDPYAMYLHNFIEGPSTTIVRRKGHTLDTKLKWLVDIDYYMSILKDNHKYAVSKEHLINMGHLATQVTNECTSDLELIFNETRYVFVKYELSYSKLYRRYLIRNAITTNHSYKHIKGIGIPYLEYLSHKIKISVKKLLKK